jgi:MraZ protein
MGRSMFYGEFEQAVDTRGKLALPAPYRARLADGCVVTRGLDGCLLIYALADWERVAGEVGRLPLTRSVARAFTRLLLGSASEQRLDAQGRLALPPTLRQWANVTNTAMVIGAGDRLEIWSDQAWTAQTAQLAQDNAAIAESLSQLGFALS